VSVTWTPPRRELIDPTKEIPAKISAIRSGIETLSDVIRQSGGHPGDQFKEIKADNDAIDALGLILDSDPRKVNKAGVAQIEPAQKQRRGLKMEKRRLNFPKENIRALVNPKTIDTENRTADVTFFDRRESQAKHVFRFWSGLF